MKRNAVVILVLYAGFSGCAKSKQQNGKPSLRDDLSLYSWQFRFTDSVRFNGAYPVSIARSSSKTCDVSQTLIFSKDGSFTEDFACTPINMQPEQGEWMFQSEDSLLTFNSSKPVKVIKLTADTLEYIILTTYYEATQSPGINGIDSLQVREVYSH